MLFTNRERSCVDVIPKFKDIFSKIFIRSSKRQVETSLIEEFWYPKYGPGQLWETVADEIIAMGGKIVRHACVDRISMEGEEHAVLTYMDTKSGTRKQISGNIVISSMPIKDLVCSMGDAAEPKIRQIAKGLPYRDFVTVGLLVDKLDLKNKTKIKTLQNMVPDCWIYVQDAGVKLGRIQIFNNWSPYMVADAENTVWIGLEYFCREGDEFWNMSEEECAACSIRELIKMGVIDHAERVLDFHREKIRKAYPAYFDTYDRMDEVINYLNRFTNLYCVGRNGQHRYNNMDHSMATAFKAVENILHHRLSKDNIWNVNTEKVYHETKEEGEL